MAVPEQAGKDPGHYRPVFQGIAGAAGGLTAVSDNTHTAVRCPNHVRSVLDQLVLAGQGYTLAGPEKSAVAEQQFRRDDAMADQLALVVDVFP